LLGALVCAVVALLLAMIVSVFVRGWPSFAHNGLAWFGAGGNVDDQLNTIFFSGQPGVEPAYTFHAWPLIWSTLLITGGAVIIGLFCSLFVSVFIVEFAPEWMRNVLEPVVRFLASVPSVIYGLLGVLVLVPFIGNHLVTEPQKASVAGVISLSGYSLLAAVLILTVMIAPLMVSIFSDGLRAVRPGWLEGSLALGVNRWRTTWKIAVRTARPAIVAGTVLAVARATGESVMLAMISGSVGFSPNPANGFIFFYEPSRPLAPTIVKNIDQLSSPPANATLFAIAAVLLFSAAMLSLAGWGARRAMRKYGATA
jgi:ABC-type phosphate transport system permease subunit